MEKQEFILKVLPEIKGRMKGLTEQEIDDWQESTRQFPSDGAVKAIKVWWRTLPPNTFQPRAGMFDAWMNPERRERFCASNAQRDVFREPGDWSHWPACSGIRITCRRTGHVRYGWIERRPKGDEIYFWQRGGENGLWYRIEIAQAQIDNFDVNALGYDVEWPWHGDASKSPQGIEALIAKDQGRMPDIADEIDRRADGWKKRHDVDGEPTAAEDLQPEPIPF